MTLAAGARLGPYQIESALGAGGMGEVYRARDTRLERTVALKILPAHLAADPQFRERFDREARTISQLTHPHICTLHDIGEHDRTAFLVLEHLEGQTLADRLTKGPLPVDQALHHALEIASALEAAHRRGVVHRDLKPGNVMLTKEGVKLLDFGLAKVGQPAVASGALATGMETVAPLTAQGTILGTFQYMAPEQLEGGEADARADIWAFGCVLYEMVAGRPAFAGKTQVSLISAILERDPAPVSEVQPLTPPGVARLIRTCLAKDPADRLQTAHDLRLQLEWVQEGGSAAGLPATVVAHRKHRVYLLCAGIALLTCAVGAATAWWLKPPPMVAPVITRFEHLLPDGQNFTRTNRHVLALSPDGSKLAYVANQQLYLRAMDQLEAQPIRGTNEDPSNPVFSPDGAWIAYFAPSRGARAADSAFALRKISIAGGAPVTLAQVPAAPHGASWGAGLIVFAMNAAGVSAIQAVPEGGGALRMLATVDPERERTAHPRLLDDGKHVLFTIRGHGTYGPQIVMQPIAGGERMVLIADGADPRVLPTGHLVYFQGGTLLAVPFDPTRLTVTGGPVPVAEGVNATLPIPTGQFVIAPNGALAFWRGTGDARRQLLWVDRDGHEAPIVAVPRMYVYPRLSPDGTRIAVDSGDEEHDVWVFDLAKETLTRLTFGQTVEMSPVWTPGGRHLIFASSMSIAASVPRDILRRAADGTGSPEALTDKLTGGTPESISPDGRWLVFRKGTFDLFVLPLNGGHEPRPLLAEPGYMELTGEISPDGRWLAYSSNESGRHEIYVRPFPDVGGGRWQISSDGGRHPLWARSGRELFYVSSGNRLVVVPIEGGPTFSSGYSRQLFDVGPYMRDGLTGRPFDISPDGRRFLMSRFVATDAAARPSIVVVSNWFEELKTRVPVR